MMPDCCGLCVISAKGGTLNVRIVRKQQAIYPAFCQTLGKRLAEMVANSSQVGFKLVASWTQELTQDYRKAMFPTTEEKVARTGTQCPPPGGFFYLVLISHNEES